MVVIPNYLQGLLKECLGLLGILLAGGFLLAGCYCLASFQLEEPYHLILSSIPLFAWGYLFSHTKKALTHWGMSLFLFGVVFIQITTDYACQSSGLGPYAHLLPFSWAIFGFLGMFIGANTRQDLL